MTDDLIARLRADESDSWQLCREAADAIDFLEVERAAEVAALESVLADALRFRAIEEFDILQWLPKEWNGCSFARWDGMWQSDERDLRKAIDTIVAEQAARAAQGEG
jgi:hypothetical protein